MQDHINNIIKSMLMEVDMFLLALDINIIVRSAEVDVNRVVGSGSGGGGRGKSTRNRGGQHEGGE